MSVLAWLDQFISALEPAFLQILNMSITASYVTLAVLLVRLLRGGCRSAIPMRFGQ